MMNYIRDTESLRFAHRDDPKQTGAVYNENGLYGHPKTLIADMLTYVGVDNAAVKSGVKASNIGTKADLIKANPDVIIVATIPISESMKAPITRGLCFISTILHTPLEPLYKCLVQYGNS